MNSWQGIRFALAALCALLVVPALAAAAPKVDGEFKVSALEANNKLVEGADGGIWVTLSDPTNDVARIDPQTGQVTEFDLGALNGVSGIAAGPDGKLWVVEAAGVTSFKPSEVLASKATTPIAAIGAANNSIVAGPDGRLWVATSDALVSIPPNVPADFSVIDVPGLSPRDIDAAAGNLIVADFAGDRLLIATPAKAANKEFTEIGSAAKPISNPQGVAGAPGGQIAFSVTAEPESVGIVAPQGTPQLTPFPETDPVGVAFGPDGAFWITHAFGPNSIPPGFLTRLGLDGKTTRLTGFAAAATPRQIAAGPGNTLWVTLPANEGDDKVARISGVEVEKGSGGGGTANPPHVLVPTTSLDKRPRPLVKTRTRLASVAFRFSSKEAGSSFECRLIRLAKKGAKPPSFAACRSPKAYRLAPGRYRFEVRAVLNGVVDRVPPAATFRIQRSKVRTTGPISSHR